MSEESRKKTPPQEPSLPSLPIVLPWAGPMPTDELRALLHDLVDDAVWFRENFAYQPPHWNHEPSAEMRAIEERCEQQTNNAYDQAELNAAAIYHSLTGKWPNGEKPE